MWIVSHENLLTSIEILQFVRWDEELWQPNVSGLKVRVMYFSWWWWMHLNHHVFGRKQVADKGKQQWVSIFFRITIGLAVGSVHWNWFFLCNSCSFQLVQDAWSVHLRRLHWTMYHHTTLRYTTHHHTTAHITTPHHTTPYYTTPHHTTPYYTTPHHTTPYHTTLHYTTPHHTTPHHTTPHHTTTIPQCSSYCTILWDLT